MRASELMIDSTGMKSIVGYEGLYSATKDGLIYSHISNKMLKPSKNTHGYQMVSLYKDGIQKRLSVHRLVAMAFIKNPRNCPCVDHINTDKNDNRVENLRWVTTKENCNNPLTLKHAGDSRRGPKHYLFGTKKSDEEREAISRRLKGHIVSEETRRKIGDANRGLIRSEELRHLWSEIKKGKNIGEKNSNAIRVKQMTKEGVLIKEWGCISDASRELNISASAISNCLTNRSKSAGGYLWLYQS